MARVQMELLDPEEKLVNKASEDLRENKVLLEIRDCLADLVNQETEELREREE